MIIDFHTHCFTDSIAKIVIDLFKEKSVEKTILDGTVGDLISHMRSCGVDKSVVLPVATNPAQVSVINKWALDNFCSELCFFGAVHPEDKEMHGTIKNLKANGFKGVKLHPDYQGFYADEKRVMPLYEAIRDEGLILLLHAGVDNVYPIPAHCTPLMIRAIIENIPGLKLIAAHMGGHVLWRDAEELLLGLPIYVDTSHSFYAVPNRDMERMIKKHGSERVLFGSDSPWRRQDSEADLLRALDLPQSDIDNILYRNALSLIG
jgi:uncharacterized protein